MDSKYESRWGIHFYLDLNGRNNNEFGIDPDMTCNNSSENDEERMQTQSEFDHKIDEILEILKKLFPELVNDGTMELAVFVKFEMSFWKLYYEYANTTQMVCFPLPKPTFCKMKRLMKYCLLMSLTRIWSILHALERKVFDCIALS